MRIVIGDSHGVTCQNVDVVWLGGVLGSNKIGQQKTLVSEGNEVGVVDHIGVALVLKDDEKNSIEVFAWDKTGNIEDQQGEKKERVAHYLDSFDNIMICLIVLNLEET